MKYLILLLLLTFNVHAAFKVEYIETATGGTYHLKRPTEIKAKKRLLKIISKSQWMKGKWNEVVSDLSKTRKDMQGNDIVSYYHPSNFTYTIKDTAQDDLNEKAIKDADKVERVAVKKFKSKINASSLPTWHKRLLKLLLKDMRSD